MKGRKEREQGCRGWAAKGDRWNEMCEEKLKGTQGETQRCNRKRDPQRLMEGSREGDI